MCHTTQHWHSIRWNVVPGLTGQAEGGDPYIRAGKRFWGCVPKLYTNFEEILSHVHGNSEEQNKFFKSAIIIIYYCIIITNAYCAQGNETLLPNWQKESR